MALFLLVSVVVVAVEAVAIVVLAVLMAVEIVWIYLCNVVVSDIMVRIMSLLLYA